MRTTETCKDKPLVVGFAKAGILLDAGDDKLYDLIKTRELDSYLEGNRRKVTIESIERYIQKQLAAASGGFQRGRYPLRRRGRRSHASATA